MLQALFSKARERRPEDVERDSPSPDLPQANPALPLIVAKVEADQRARSALKRMGYLKVLLAYLRHKRAGKDTFHAFGADHLWPTMYFVQDWLKSERRQLTAQHGWVFLLALMATVVAGLAFLAALALLG
jgi:hypothetical protein